MGRYAFFLLPLPAVAVAVLWFYLPEITNRPDIYVSIEERGAILTQSIENAELVSTKFGRSTNSGVLLSASMGGNEGVIADSFYIAVLSNTGFIGLLMMIAAMIAWGAWVLYARRLDALCATLIWGLFALTTQITEAFPANLILAIMIGYFLRRASIRKYFIGDHPHESLGKPVPSS